jgi:hypothetical protein
MPLFATRLSYSTFGGMPRPNYAVAPDGQRFLMNVLAQESSASPLTILLNCRGLQPAKLDENRG